MNKIIISKNNNPHYNLALEEHLIDEKINCLYLWVNGPTIVIGKNQNAYSETDLEKLEEDNVYLARRKSGGGAVYHDLGNLCFTIISKINGHNVEENFDFVTEALKKVGINAKFTGRNDILVNDKKISGNAFYEKGDIYCHHGTIMVNLNTDIIDRYLTPSKIKLESKAIKSTKSRVINLVDINEDLTVDKIIDLLSQEYKKIYPQAEIVSLTSEDMLEDKDVKEKYEFYSSKQWILDNNPQYNVNIEEKFSWGIIEIKLDVKNGYIQGSKIYTDSIIVDNFDNLADELKGVELNKEEIKKFIISSIENEEIQRDIISIIPKLFH